MCNVFFPIVLYFHLPFYRISEIYVSICDHSFYSNVHVMYAFRNELSWYICDIHYSRNVHMYMYMCNYYHWWIYLSFVFSWFVCNRKNTHNFLNPNSLFIWPLTRELASGTKSFLLCCHISPQKCSLSVISLSDPKQNISGLGHTDRRWTTIFFRSRPNR